MREEKKILLRIILNYLFADEKSIVRWELPAQFPEEERVEFARPSTADGAIVMRHVIVWTPKADFQVYRIGAKGAHIPVSIRTSRWFKAHRYMISNFISVKSFLNVTEV